MKKIVVHLRCYRLKHSVMEQEVFERLLVEQQQQLRTFAASLTRDAVEIDDLCQETNFRALQNAGKFEAETNIDAWLQTIMRHIFFNDFRRSRHLQQIKQQIAGSASVWVNGIQTDKGVQSLNGLEEQQILRSVFHALPSKLRIPFVLYFNGHAYRDISRLIKKPMGTVKNRIFKAKRQLSNLLGRK